LKTKEKISVISVALLSAATGTHLMGPSLHDFYVFDDDSHLKLQYAVHCPKGPVKGLINDPDCFKQNLVKSDGHSIDFRRRPDREDERVKFLSSSVSKGHLLNG
jgi:hypothetical protein